MKFYPFFQLRELTGTLIPPHGELTVKTMDYAAMGGCDVAEMEFTGNLCECQKWLNMLRVPLWIRDEHGQNWWWGYVEEVPVRDGGLQYGLTLDDMANKVRVQYGGGTFTDWTSDVDSQTTYGIIEHVESISEVTATYATIKRDLMLAAMSRPTKTFATSRDIAEFPKVTIRCRGWWRTLDWKTYSHASLTQTNFVEAGVNWFDTTPLYHWNGDYKCGQVFTYPADAEAAYMDQFALWVQGVYVGDGHSLQFTYNFYTNPANWTGTLIATSGFITISSNPLNWVYANMRAPGTGARVALVPGQGYWFEVPVQEEAVAGCKFHADLRYTGGWNGTDGGGWNLLSPAARVSYQMTMVQESTTQISTLIGSAAFIVGAQVEVSSGNYRDAWRDGSMTMAAVLQELLEAGSSNNRRLLAWVTHDRYLRVFEEPAGSRTAATVIVDREGRFWNAARTPLTKAPVGEWCRVLDAMLPETNPDPLLVFIERIQLDCETGFWQNPDPRGTESAYKVGGLNEN